MRMISGALIVLSSLLGAQAPRAATYITAEEVQTVNRQPGIDHTIRVVDIGNENFAIGVIHRVPGGARQFTPAPSDCGQSVAAPPADGMPGGITHDSQTEGYFILSGGGTLVTGGHLVNGHGYAADNDVVKTLNGPSCSGTIVGGDVVKRAVKAGDIIIIPAGVPHGWIDITDHVDYLSFRPSDHVLQAGYVHPSIKK
jgi:mannose-6-phosphate isomerase-like protein (cupin superfamily)